MTSFGEDEIGNMYYVQLDGNLFKIAAVPEPATASLFALGVALLAAKKALGSKRKISTAG